MTSLFSPPDLSVVPTTSSSIHPQTVRSSSSSSSHHASTSELNDAPGPSTSCPGSVPESMHTQRSSGSTRTATEGKEGPGTLIQSAVRHFISLAKRRSLSNISFLFPLIFLIKMLLIVFLSFHPFFLIPYITLTR